MKSRSPRIDVDGVMGLLKDFQRATVDYVFKRMYLDSDRTRRFLVADEVGLGKTLVARGIIARAIRHLQQQGVPRIDVVYICSNADIARQNTARLNVTGVEDFEFTSRITMLPEKLPDLEHNHVNLVSFTPGTSFDLASSTGRAEERALMCRLLRDAFDLSRTGLMNVLQVYKETEGFRGLVRQYEHLRGLNPRIAKDYGTTVERGVFCSGAGTTGPLLPALRDLCKAFHRSRKHVPSDEWNDSRRMVGKLRSLLAATCLKILQPDLIILDEFQRFKHLLETDSEAGILAREMFNYSEGDIKARVLLLSATPYKMYTIDGVDDEDHYEDLCRTLNFLGDGCAEKPDFAGLLQDYRNELLRLGKGGGRLPEARERLAGALRRVMVRTERLAVTQDRKGMLDTSTRLQAELRPADFASYVGLHRVSSALGHGDVLELWKSAPYLLNFMEGYKLKDLLRERVEEGGGTAALARTLESLPGLLARADVERYRAVDPGNARLRALQRDLSNGGLWRLLWVPPSLTYYEPGGPFANAAARRFTKKLVFSSWLVVPRAVSAMLSYEAERLMVTSFYPHAVNPQGERKRRPPLLRFSLTDGRLTGMPVLALVYPCTTLARECDPLSFFCATDRAPSRQSLLHAMERRVERLLRSLRIPDVQSGPEDEAWYWLAPMLLDYEHDPRAFLAWLERDDIADCWGREIGDDAQVSSYWREHVEKARSSVEGYRAGKPVLQRRPADLARVLAQMGVAGFGTVILRALARVTGGRRVYSNVVVRDATAAPAHAFLSLFNTPESMAMVRGLFSDGGTRDLPYWRQVLQYALDGGLQSVMDEYVHMLYDSPEYVGKPSSDVASSLAASVHTAMSLRPAQPGVDWVGVTRLSRRIRIERGRLRSRFAMRFGDEESDLAHEGVRAGQIRRAFNSPFWPFVLVTTSIGQEGLDFHCYCHAVVHWNLPSNPVDLEQREGRVHRYKGHAVRRNVAARYGSGRAIAGAVDPWSAMFQQAHRGRDAGTSDIWPYWVCTSENGAVIERHVPMLPLSREPGQLASLLRSLAAYRMVFGQARQEDLLRYLMFMGVADSAADLNMDLSPPPRR